MNDKVELVSTSSQRRYMRVFLSARHSKPVGIARNRSVCVGRYAYVSGSLKMRNLTRWWWWWYYPTPSEGWERGGTPRRPHSRATPQGLDHRSRIERGAKDRPTKGPRGTTVEEELIEVL